MTKDQLLAAVPVHWADKYVSYIRHEEIPEPWRSEFVRTNVHVPRPIIAGGPDPIDISFAREFREFVNFGLHGVKPSGLAD